MQQDAAILADAAKNPGKSVAQLAIDNGAAKDTVDAVLRKYNSNIKEVDDYRKNRVEIIAGIQGKLLKTLATKDCTEASVQQLATAAAILIDKERLLTGQSTANIATFSHLVAEIEGAEVDITPDP